MRIAILGFGVEGKSVQCHLKNTPEYQKAAITVLDKKSGSDYLKNLERFSAVFRSPGIPYLLPEIQKARKSGVKISSATQLFFESAMPILRRGSGQVIGVTGTKGKSTTATLIYKILKEAGENAFLAGNIGTPALEILPKLQKKSVIVLELSSFQLQDLKQSPHIGIILDIAPEHQDYHQTFNEYVAAKSAIARYQKPQDLLIFSKTNHWAKYLALKSPATKIGFSLNDKNKFLSKIKKSIRIPGTHNLQNAYAAGLAAKHLGIPEKNIIKIIQNFNGLEYRLQLIKKEPKIYNDSASTNPEAVMAGIRAVNPTILLMGGVNKNLSYKNLTIAIQESPIKKIFLFGQNRNELNQVLKNTGAEIKIFPDLTKLVLRLKNNAAKNDVVLFSPGSASFNQFKNYQERGKTFNKLIK